MNKNQKGKKPVYGYVRLRTAINVGSSHEKGQGDCMECLTKEVYDQYIARGDEPILREDYEDWVEKRDKVSVKEKESKVNILLDGYRYKRIHPALDFVDDCCYIGIFLPVEDMEKDFESEALCILCCNLATERKELFPADKTHLKERNILLKCKPVHFEKRISLDTIKRFISGSKTTPKPKKVFNEVRRMFKYYIEFPCEEAYDYFSLWTIGTYFHPLFRTYPYTYIGGMKDSGKTKTLTVTHSMAFNSIFSGNLSTSSMFRLIQNARTTLMIDETESLSNPERAQEFRNILLSGYKQGSKVYRSERNRRDRFEVSEFEPYSPKIIANIRGLEDILGSRCIPFIMKRTINKDIGNREIDPNDPIWQEIRDSICIFTLKYCKAMRQTYESLKNEANINNREWELWHPILAIAKLIDYDLYLQMLKLAKKKADERQIENITETGEYILVETISEIVENDAYYKVKDIQGKMKEKFDEEQKWLNTKWVGRTLGRLGFTEKRRVGTGVEYKLSSITVRDIAERLGVHIGHTQTSQSPQTTLSEVSVVSAVSEGLIDNKCSWNPPAPNSSDEELKHWIYGVQNVVANLSDDKVIEMAVQAGWKAYKVREALDTKNHPNV